MANLPNPSAQVLNLRNNQQAYEDLGLPPNSKRAQSLRNVRNHLIPEFIAFQVNAEGAAANGLAFYQANYPNEVFGGLLACFMHWLTFRR